MRSSVWFRSCSIPFLMLRVLLFFLSLRVLLVVSFGTDVAVAEGGVGRFYLDREACFGRSVPPIYPAAGGGDADDVFRRAPFEGYSGGFREKRSGAVYPLFQKQFERVARSCAEHLQAL